MTLPPIVPTWRVAGEPTSALPSARPVQPSCTSACTSISAWLASAPSTSVPPSTAIESSSPTPWMPTRFSGSGELALAGTDDEIGAARDRACAPRDGRQRLVERVGGGVAHAPASCMCSQTRSGVIGSCFSGLPVSL